MDIHTYQDRDPAWWVAAFNHPVPRIDSVDEIRAWCYTTFGPPNSLDYTGRWRDNIWWGEARFRSEEDLLLFVMRWS